MNRELLMTYAVGFCVLFTLVAMFTYVTFQLAAPPFGLSSAALGSLFVVYLIGAIITPLAGRWIDVYGHRPALTAAMAMSAFGSSLTLTHNLAVVILGLALCCSGAFIAQATATSHVGAAAHHDRGVAVGLYVTFYYIGGSVGGAVPAWFWNKGGWPACVALVIAVQLTTMAIGWLFWRDLAGHVEEPLVEGV
jgi:MFS family permease